MNTNEDPNNQISSINNELSNMLKGFSQKQCQEVMSALLNNMIIVNPGEETTNIKYYSIFVNPGQKYHKWIMDYGATQHVCHKFSMFHNKRKVNNYIVTLPNKITLLVKLISEGSFVCSKKCVICPFI